MNYPKMDTAKVQALIDNGRIHLSSVCSLYRRHMAKGKIVLREHQATALSWKEGQIDELARNTYCHVVWAINVAMDSHPNQRPTPLRDFQR